MKRWASDAPARGMAVGSHLAAGVLLAPLIALSPPVAVPPPLVAVSMLALGLVCGAIAYLLYFRLVADIGATGALTVTYLIPVFGVLWGALFLGEAVSLLTLAGAGLVIVGTVLVLMQPGARIRRARSAYPRLKYTCRNSAALAYLRLGSRLHDSWIRRRGSSNGYGSNSTLRSPVGRIVMRMPSPPKPVGIGSM